MTIVTIRKGIMMTEGLKNHTVHFDFPWKRASHLKNMCWHYTRSFNWN